MFMVLLIAFIRQRVAQKGLKEFYALEILEAVVPDPQFFYSSSFQCSFSWKHFGSTEEGEKNRTNKTQNDNLHYFLI